MRIVIGLLVTLAFAAAMAGCNAPASPSSVETAPGVGTDTQLPTLPVPGASVKPGVPSSTIEIPPPIY